MLAGVLAAAVSLGSLAPTAAGAASGGRIEGAKLARVVASAAVPAYPGIPVGKVTCPKRIPLKKGKVSVCTVDVGGVPVRYDVTQTNKKGAVTVASAQAVIGKASAEQFVKDNTTIPAQVTVDCGPAPVIAKLPGETFACTATFGDGSTKQVTIAVTDLAGNATIVQVA